MFYVTGVHFSLFLLPSFWRLISELWHLFEYWYKISKLLFSLETWDIRMNFHVFFVCVCLKNYTRYRIFWNNLVFWKFGLNFLSPTISIGIKFFTISLKLFFPRRFPLDDNFCSQLNFFIDKFLLYRYLWLHLVPNFLFHSGIKLSHSVVDLFLSYVLKINSNNINFTKETISNQILFSELQKIILLVHFNCKILRFSNNIDRNE